MIKLFCSSQVFIQKFLAFFWNQAKTMNEKIQHKMYFFNICLMFLEFSAQKTKLGHDFCCQDSLSSKSNPSQNLGLHNDK